ncbi:MAG: TIGR02391 family protein, partial [Chloroherpetonaceae bacterium]|nr:TIGR02391 family protein [Chloroherpetonaceae bacterium]
LEKICEVLTDTSPVLTGSAISKLLAQLRIEDPSPGATKRVRLFEALWCRQNQDGCGNLVAAFIQEAMNPVRYTEDPRSFELKRDELNKVLAFAGYFLGEDGKLRFTEPVKTLTEAEALANRLRTELSRRNVHPDVLRFCRAEWLEGNCFHAVLEATKSLAEKIRAMSGLTTDGAELVDQAFGLGKAGLPILAFNTLRSETERSEHTGLMNLMKGVFGTFRNPTAHEPRIFWNITEQDALDILTLLSFLHRRLDSAVRTPRYQDIVGHT